MDLSNQESRVESQEPEGAGPRVEERLGPSRATWPLAVLLVLAALVLLTLQARRPRAPHPLEGVALPSLQVGGWINSDRPLSTDDLRGQVVLVDFWATYCPACVHDLPELAEFHQRFREQGLQVVGLTPETNTQGELAQFVERLPGMDWPIGHGAGFTFDLMGIQYTPTYVLFDRTGRSVWAGNSLDRAEDAAIEALAGKVKSGKVKS